MASVLPPVADCCSPCSGTATVEVPGPQGPAGSNGTNGTNGVNAFTTVAVAAFAMPAEGATVVATVGTNAWATIGQIVYVQTAGWMEVTGKAGTTSLTLKNLESTALGKYTDNAAPVTPIVVGSQISPGGLQGPAGADGTGGMDTSATNAVLPAARTNLGLGSVSTLTAGVANGNVPTVNDVAGLTNGEAVFATATGIESKTAATARTALGLGIGVNVQAYDAFLTALGLLGTAANKMIYTTGVDTAAETDLSPFARTLLDDLTAAAAQVTLGVLAGYGILGSLTAASLNPALPPYDHSISMLSGRYRIDKVVLESPSAAVTTATAGLFTTGGGVGALCLDQALSGTLTGTTKFMDMVTEAIVGTDHITSGTLYFRIGTPEGAVRTVNVKIYGWKFD